MNHKHDQVHASVLAGIATHCFAAAHRLLVTGGAHEPEYLPGEINRLYYREDYAASVLHEMAHWCVAGAKRRQLVDFGYWYEPDGRDQQTQQRFERFEARNQAVGQYLCAAAGIPFLPSTDNLSGNPVNEFAFSQAIEQERLRREQDGWPPRACTYANALRSYTAKQAAKI